VPFTSLKRDLRKLNAFNIAHIKVHAHFLTALYITWCQVSHLHAEGTNCQSPTHSTPQNSTPTAAHALHNFLTQSGLHKYNLNPQANSQVVAWPMLNRPWPVLRPAYETAPSQLHTPKIKYVLRSEIRTGQTDPQSRDSGPGTELNWTELNCLQRKHKSDSRPIKFHAPPIKKHSSSGISSTVCCTAALF
jgi:hypothetical protein